MRKKIEVVASFIKKNDRFLIAKKGNFWEFPGGKVKEGEDLRNGLIREIREELDVEIEVLNLLFSYENEDYIFYFFESRIKRGRIFLKEHKTFKWISFKDIKKYKFYKPDEKFLSSMAYIE